MPDYQSMYFALAAQVADVIDLLFSAQSKTAKKALW